MEHLWLVLLIIAFIAILFIWWYTAGRNDIPESTVIDLSTSENKILDVSSLPETIDFTPPAEIATQYLQQQHGLTPVAADRIQLTNDYLGKEQSFNLRDEVGLDLQIVVFEDGAHIPDMISPSMDEIAKLQKILQADLLGQATEIVHRTLDDRWRRLLELSFSSLRNDSGSYAYFEEWPLTNVKVATRDSGYSNYQPQQSVHQPGADYRLNMLCTEVEFNNTLRRMAKFMGNAII